MTGDSGLVHLVKAGDPKVAKEHGLTLLAHCGLIWIPRKRRLKDFPPCPDCEAIGGPITDAARPGGELTASERRPHYVYRCYDEEGSLLYVGCTVDLPTRRLSHAAQSWWFPQAASFRVTLYPNRRHALRVEAATILAEHPLWNVRHQDFRRWPKEQLERGHLLAAAVHAPAAVQRRFTRLTADQLPRAG